MMAKNLEDHNIRLALGQTVKAIQGDGKVERLVTDKETFDVDMVVLAVGFRPNTALGAGKLETFRNGAYLVNKKQETSIKDVYAVGDCATVYDNALDDVNYIALASNAVRSGIVGGHNAGGGDVESNGVQGSNGISIYGLNMVSTGLTEEKAKRFGFNPAVVESTDLQKAASWKMKMKTLQSRSFMTKIHAKFLVLKWYHVWTSLWVSTCSHWLSKKV